MRSPRNATIALLTVLVLSVASLAGLAAGATQAGAQDLTSSTTTTLDETLTTTPALDADNAPDYDGGDDLDLERLSGPRVADSSPGRAAGLPLGIAAVAIMVVVVVLVVRSARFNKAKQAQKPGPPQG